MESEDNFRKNSFRSKEKESVSNVSEPAQNKDINTTGQQRKVAQIPFGK